MATGRIEKGQPIAKAISAAAWNRAQDAADAVLGVQAGFAGGPSRMNAGASNIVLVRNDTGSEVKASGILGVSGIANAGTDAANEMPSICQNPVIICVAPTETDHASRFVVTLEPIEVGKVGRAAVAGTVAFRLESSSTSHKFATVKDSSTLVAKSADGGLLRILSRSTVGQSGWVWAVGVLDNAGGSGSVRLCKTSAAFNKGTTATLNVWEDGTPASETQTSGETLQVVNKFANVAADRWVLVAKASNGAWYLAEYEENSGSCANQIGSYQLSDIPLYDASKTQILSHTNGCLRWINTTTCPTT